MPLFHSSVLQPSDGDRALGDGLELVLSEQGGSGVGWEVGPTFLRAHSVCVGWAQGLYHMEVLRR